MGADAGDLVAPEGDTVNYLDYWGLTENPLNSRDFVHTEKVIDIINYIKAGNSIKVLGPAGIGKSAVMREAKATLEEKIDEKYVFTVVGFNWLVDSTNTALTRDGMIALAHYVDAAFKTRFKKLKDKGINEDYPTASYKHLEFILSNSDNIGPAVRFFHLQELFKKIKADGFKPVVVFDDADPVPQYFDNYDNLNSITELSHSTVFCYKYSEKAAGAQNATRPQNDETHTELAARRDRLEAFLRRSVEVVIEGQTAYNTLKIIRGKLGKRDLLTDEALACGLKVAECGTKSQQTSLQTWSDGKNIAGCLLYNPGKIGMFLSYCLELACKQSWPKNKKIDTEIAAEAYRKTLINSSGYVPLDSSIIARHLEEIKKARAELKAEA